MLKWFNFVMIIALSVTCVVLVNLHQDDVAAMKELEAKHYKIMKQRASFIDLRLHDIEYRSQAAGDIAESAYDMIYPFVKGRGKKIAEDFCKERPNHSACKKYKKAMYVSP